MLVSRKKAQPRPPKNYQLDQFDPADGRWEYSDRRHVGYDVLTLVLGSRFPGELARRLADFVAGRNAAANPIADLSWLDDHATRQGRRLLAYVLLLEDLLLRLEEDSNPCFTSVGGGLATLQNEITKCVQ